MHDHVLSWGALEYHHFEKSSDWYWSVGIIIASFVILSLLFENVLLAIFILLAGTCGALYAGRHPDVVHVELRYRGIFYHDRLYPYHSLESFYIEEDSHFPKILIKSKKFLMPLIIIPLGEVHIHHNEIRAYLLRHLKEVEHKESTWHLLLEHLGF